MGTTKLYATATYGGHANLVIGARKEAGEGVEENAVLPPGGQANAGADHILLGDVALEEAVGIRLLEDLGEGGIFDVAAHGHQLRIYGADALAERSRRLRG